MTRWVEVIHFEIDHREVRTVVPIDLTYDDFLAQDESVFIEARVNPDKPDEITYIRTSKIVAYRTVTEKPVQPEPAPVTSPSTWTLK